ncbi:MAG: transcriptional repressor LexA [Ignavibacteriaceae bacterium]|jgi:repressor LexA|nr:transcriptional repressor LexA [Ignavibacteriaceae bacterium]
MKKELTEKQNNILSFIDESITANGYPPTYREIGKQFGISSTFGVKRHIDALIKKGYVTAESNSNRTLSIIDNTPKNKSVSFDNSVEIPIVGRVAAGQPILAQENIDGNILLDRSMINGRSDCFGLKVKGDSMKNAGIYEGDLVIVSPQKDANNGDIVIALLGDEATMKRFMKTKDRVVLRPENDDFSDIVVEDIESFSLIGKVVGVFRTYN